MNIKKGHFEISAKTTKWLFCYVQNVIIKTEVQIIN